MKTRWMTALLLIAAISLTACSKKEESAPPKAPAVPDVQEEAGMVDTMKEKATEAMNEALTMEIDLDKSIADLKAEAEKMSLENLQAVAGKYKDSIMEKQVDIDKIMEKMKSIPITEQLGTDAMKLKDELSTLNDALTPLKERLNVYVAAIKLKGGDVSALKDLL